jgi:Tfp pilus assembly protein PilE
MRSMNRQNKEAGFNLIEAAIVLGIVGLVVAGIWAAAAAAYENMRQQGASKNLLAFAQNVKNYYANSGATTVSTAATTLIAAGLVPKDMLVGTNAIVHPWGNTAAPGNVRVANGATAGTFVIYFMRPTQVTTNDWIRICNNLIARNYNSGKNVGMTWGIVQTAATRTTQPSGSSCTAGGDRPSFQFSIQG